MSNELKKVTIEVFRVGKQTDSSGNTKEWTQEDLDTIVKKYNEQEAENRHEAPVVLGHPKTDSPAYGWVESLKREGDVLFAQLKDLKDEFVQWVRDGHYKKRSISLYNDMNLKHVGFLGGTPPAIKGLTDPAFKENESDFITYEMAAEQDIANTVAKSIKYGIGVKNTNNTKPIAYKDLDDESFADPVNYLYPIHDLPNLLSSIKSFDRWDVSYNGIEKQVITARILSAAQSLGMDIINDDRLRYFQEDNSKQNINFKQGDLGMPNPNQESKHIADDYIKLVANFCKDNYGDEVGEQVLSMMEKNKTLIKSTTPQKEEEPQFSAFMESKEYKEMQTKLERVEKANQELKENNIRIANEAYFNEQKNTGQLVTKQKEIVGIALEVARNGANKTYNFSDSTVDGEVVIKKLIESFPKQVEFSEFASGGQNRSTSTIAEEDKYIEEYNKAMGF